MVGVRGHICLRNSTLTKCILILRFRIKTGDLERLSLGILNVSNIHIIFSGCILQQNIAVYDQTVLVGIVLRVYIQIDVFVRIAVRCLIFSFNTGSFQLFSRRNVLDLIAVYAGAVILLTVTIGIIDHAGIYSNRHRIGDFVRERNWFCILSVRIMFRCIIVALGIIRSTESNRAFDLICSCGIIISCRDSADNALLDCDSNRRYTILELAVFKIIRRISRNLSIRNICRCDIILKGNIRRENRASVCIEQNDILLNNHVGRICRCCNYIGRRFIDRRGIDRADSRRNHHCGDSEQRCHGCECFLHHSLFHNILPFIISVWNGTVVAFRH